jgi:hypothetical protein
MIFIDLSNKNKSGVYCIYNTVNGKFYIGSTVNFYKRYRQHIIDLKRKKHHSIYLQRAFDKYGLDAFEFKTIEIVDDCNLLRSKEQTYLFSLNPFIRSIGYNASDNAFGSNARLDIENYRNKLGKRIVAYDLEGKFVGYYKSSTEAADSLGIGNPGIRQAARKISKSFNWQFRFTEGDDYPNAIPPYSLKGRHRTNETIDKIVATRKRNGNSEKFKAHLLRLNGKKKGPMPEEQKIKISQAHKGKVKTKEHILNNANSINKPIVAFDWLGYPAITFLSLTAAANHFGINRATLSPYVKGGRPYKDLQLVFLNKNNKSALAATA